MNLEYIKPIYIDKPSESFSNEEFIVGSYNKTYLIRTGVTRFTPFECEVIKFKETELGKFLKFIEMHRRKANIVVDDDAVIFISFLVKTMRDNFLIYSMSQIKCLTIYEYVADKYQIKSYQLNIYQIEQLLMSYVVINYGFKNSLITWNATNMVNKISELKHELFFKVLLEYFRTINNNSNYSINAQLNRELITYINTNFNTFAKYSENYQLQPCQYKNINNNDLFNALNYLANL